METITQENYYQNEIAIQPPHIKLPLKLHQLGSIHRMMQLEQSNIIDVKQLIGNKYDETEQITHVLSTVGILSDQVGAGKSYEIMGLVDLFPLVLPKPYYPIEYHNSTSFYRQMNQKVDPDPTEIIPCTLCIIPHSIASQWNLYLTIHTTSDYSWLVIRRSKQFEYDLEKRIALMKQYRLIVITSTLVSSFVTDMKSQKIRISRLVIDEADSINFTGISRLYDNLPIASFVWLVSASIANILSVHANNRYYHLHKREIDSKYHGWKSSGLSTHHPTYHFLQDLPLHLTTFRNICFVYNNPEFVVQSMNIPDYISYVAHIPDPQIVRMFQGIGLTAEISNMINAGNIQGAIEQMQIGQYTSNDLIDAICKNQQTRLQNLQIDRNHILQYNYVHEPYRVEALTKNQMDIDKILHEMDLIKQRIDHFDDCCICYEPIQTRSLMKCCQKSCCFVCITRWLKDHTKCPYCRSTLYLKELLVINENLVKPSPPQQPPPSELEVDEQLSMMTITEQDWVATINRMKTKPLCIKAILGFQTPEIRKVLIFSSYDGTFGALRTELIATYSFCEILSGTGFHIAKTINMFKENTDPISIVMLNAQNFGSGLNLEFVTDVIIYHKVASDTKKQIIGRAQRIGRTSVLRVWEMLYKNEVTASG